MKRSIGYLVFPLMIILPAQVMAKTDKPNILVIMSDDVMKTMYDAGEH